MNRIPRNRLFLKMKTFILKITEYHYKKLKIPNKRELIYFHVSEDYMLLKY